MLFVTGRFERRSHLFRYRHAHRHPAGSLRDGGPFHGAAFGPGGPFENPLGERADDDGGDHTVVPEKLRTLDHGRPWSDDQFASTRLSSNRDMSR